MYNIRLFKWEFLQISLDFFYFNNNQLMIMASNILNIEDLKPGLTVKIHQKIKETNAKGAEKERVQIYEGIIIGMKKNSVTIRKISHGIGVEKIFPLDLPAIDKIELVKEARGNVRRAKLNYLRKSPRAMREN